MLETQTLQDDTLELIAWREYSQVFSVVEQLARANRHLLHLEKHPPGLRVFLPDKKENLTQKAKRLGA